MATMDVLKALDELKDAGVEERSARAMQRLRVGLRRETDARLCSFAAHRRA